MIRKKINICKKKKKNSAPNSKLLVINSSAAPGCLFRFSVLFSARALCLSEEPRMRSHPSLANSHQSGPMLEPLREEVIAHSTGAHSPSTQGAHGHLTHQVPVYFSPQSHPTVYMCVCNSVYLCQCIYVCVSMFAKA